MVSRACRASFSVGAIVLATAGGCGRRPAPRTDDPAPQGSAPTAASVSAKATASVPTEASVPPAQAPIVGLVCEAKGGPARLLPNGDTAPLLAIWPRSGGRDAVPTPLGSFIESSRGRDGAVYLSAAAGMMRVGDPLVAIFSFPYDGVDRASGDRLALSKGGVAWWGSFQLWESAVFPPTRREDFTKVSPPNVRSFKGVAYDDHDRLWVATDDAVWVRENEAWTKAELPAFPNVRGLVTFAGTAHVLLSPKLVAYPDAATAPKVVATLPTAAEEMRVGKRGIVVRLAPTEGKRAGALVRYDGQGQKTLAGQMDSLIDYDESGVVWGRELDGYLAIDEAGKRTHWPRGSIPGFSQDFTKRCFVAGSYEVLPTVGRVRYGAAKGAITQGGKPVANARFELCESLPFAHFATKTPCGGNGAAGKTDANGTFVIAKLPIGKYHWVVQLGDTWKGSSLLASSGLPVVTEDATADYGTLALE